MNKHDDNRNFEDRSIWKAVIEGAKAVGGIDYESIGIDEKDDNATIDWESASLPGIAKEILDEERRLEEKVTKEAKETERLRTLLDAEYGDYLIFLPPDDDDVIKG